MWLHIIVVILTQCCSTVKNSYWRNMANYLAIKTERRSEGEMFHIACDPKNKVTAHTNVSVSPS